MVNSLSGHRVVPTSKLRFYAATKFTVTGLCEGWRNEIRAMEPANYIRIAQVSPGLVRTEFQDVADSIKTAPNALKAEDLADMIRYILKAPKHVQISDILVRPT